MKRIFVLFLTLLGVYSAQAQSFNFALTGNPINTTGWTTSPSSYVNNDEFVLTDPQGTQAGYIYYSTPQNLTNCSQFTVTFEFRITNSSIPTADGIAFWYISNPPTSFINGGGLGLPSNPDGLVLLLDTYNNDGFPVDNPLVSLRRYDGSTANYTEGSATGRLAPDATNQTFIVDGNWHTCTLTYSFGTVTVSFDNNPPILTGTTTMNINGYFGFSASTGASWAKHAIKNVTISGAPEPDPPVTDTVFYCQNEPAVPLTAQGDNLQWYTSATGGTPFPAPTPSTNAPGTYTWYVSTSVPGCNLESSRAAATVVVHPLPPAPDVTVPVFCSGQAAAPITIQSGENIQWYEQATGGTGTATAPTINTDAADTITWFVTQTDSFGCESLRDSVNMVIHQTPIAAFSTTLALSCESDTVFFQNNSQYANDYFWDFSDGITDTVPAPTHVYANTGSYFVTLIARNDYCSDTSGKLIGVGHPLKAAFDVSADTICQGDAVQFTNTSEISVVNGISPTYQWDFQDGAPVTSENATHSFPEPGRYPVRLIAQNGIPCRDTAYHLIVVDSTPQLSLHQSDSIICQGDHVIFTADITTDGLHQIAWSLGDRPDTFLNSNPMRHSFEDPGNYEIFVRGSYRACPDVSGSLRVRVNEMPHINLGPDTSLCLDGAPIRIGDQINDGNPSARWEWNTGDTTSDIVIRHEGVYANTVTIDHCSTTDKIIVKKDCYLDIPNSFTPNNDGVNDYFLPRQTLASGITAFNLSVYNRWGEKVFQSAHTNGRGWDGTFNGKPQPVGVYIYQIEVWFHNGKQESYTGNVTLLR